MDRPGTLQSTKRLWMEIPFLGKEIGRYSDNDCYRENKTSK